MSSAVLPIATDRQQTHGESAKIVASISTNPSYLLKAEATNRA